MIYQKITTKYLNLSKKYDIDIKINLVENTNYIQKIVDNEIFINITKLSENNFEEYLSYNFRKLFLPKLSISTNRLILRRFKVSDAQDCFEFLSDRDTCYSDGGFEPFENMNEEYYSLMDKFLNQQTRYMIVLKEENKVIGTINLMDVTDRVVEAMEIGYVINPHYRKKGYAYEAVNTLVNLLIEDLHLDLLLAASIESNIASLNMIKKLGFKYEGIKTKSFYHPIEGIIDLKYFYKCL